MRLLSKADARFYAKQTGTKIEWFNGTTKSFVLAGTQTGMQAFRNMVACDLGGLAYIVTDNGSYPTHGSRIYTPMEVAQ